MDVQNSSTNFSYEWEYYYGYVDPVIVDESKLQYNKYSVVIIFWVVLATFVGFLFLSLNLMSVSGSIQRCYRPKNTRTKQRRTSTA